MNRRGLAGVLVMMVTSPGVVAHVSNRNLSMRASTVIELDVQAQEVAVRMELGPGDEAAFASVLNPDETDDSRGFGFLANQTEVLTPRVVSRVRGPRTHRDTVTGKVIEPGTKPEEVTIVTMVFPLRSKPEILEIRPPLDTAGRPAAEIGFLAKHRGLPVNHFAYLRQPQLMLLDWGDPWHTRFRDSRLRRAFADPLEVFVVIDGGDVRLEVAVHPADLRGLIGIRDAGEVIPADDRESWAKAIEALVRERMVVSMDGEEARWREATGHFVRRDLGGVEVIPPVKDLDLRSAVFALVLTGDARKAEEIAVACHVFGERITRVPLTISHGTERSAHVLTPDQTTAQWTIGEAAPPIRPPLPAGGSIPVKHQVIPWALPILVLTLLILSFAWQRMGWAARITLVVLPVAFGWASAWRGWEITIPDRSKPAALITEETANLVGEVLLEGILRTIEDGHGEAGNELAELCTPATGEAFQILLAPHFRPRNVFGTPLRLRRMVLRDRSYQAPPTEREIVLTGTMELTLGTAHWGHVHPERRHIRFELRIESPDTPWRITAAQLVDDSQGDRSKTTK